MFPKKKALGIDIGTSSIKAVELSSFGSRVKLENYGELKAPSFYKKPFRTFEKSTVLLSTEDVAKGLLALITEARIKSKSVVFSIPDFSTFFTWFTLPSMSREEVATAVRYEARQHIPLPLSEVALDWQIIEGKLDRKSQKPLKILLVAVPREIINQYQDIVSAAGLNLEAVEAEVFALSRSCVNNKKEVLALIDIGAQSTTASIIDKGILKRSHSFDVSGNEFSKVIAKSLNIDYSLAVHLKEKYGFKPISQFAEPDIPYGQDLKDILAPLFDIIFTEVENITDDFYRQENKKAARIILAGGSALLPGAREYFSEKLQIKTEIAQSFNNIFYPPILEQTLKEMSPSFAIAVGAALRGLE